VEPFKPIHIFSAGRPRWAAQLCKLAGLEAYNTDANKIAFGHIRSVLRKYGDARLSDLYKEHRHQCSNIEAIVEAFGNGPTVYTTQQLLDRITERIIKRVGMPNIDGMRADNGSISIANFLYRIGFVAARDDGENDTLGFIRFEERPTLLTTVSNLDDGLRWEIHPSYRDALRIRPTRENDPTS